jgi:S1/P1 Nuclease
MKKLFCTLILVSALVLPQSVLAWNGTGHRLVASIAWDNLSDTARKNIVNLLLQAPKGNCLRELFKSTDGEREFFVAAATWPDIIRSGPEKSIAEAGYRLADLLETLFGH